MNPTVRPQVAVVGVLAVAASIIVLYTLGTTRHGSSPTVLPPYHIASSSVNALPPASFPSVQSSSNASMLENALSTRSSFAATRSSAAAMGNDTSFLSCSPLQLTASISVASAADAISGRIFLKNQSSEPCQANGYAQVQIMDSTGNILVASVRHVSGNRKTHALDPSQTLQERFAWSNWCNGQQKGPFSLKIMFVGHTEYLLAPMLDASGMPSPLPSCLSHAQDSLISLGFLE